MSDFTPLVAPARKRNMPVKVDPKQKRLKGTIQTIKPMLKKQDDVAAITTTQVLEEGDSSKVFEQTLNDLFKSLDEKKPEVVNKKKYCPLHLGVLKKKVSRRG